MGIYKITNIKNNKMYIGSSKNIEFRWKEHIYNLNNNKHHSIKLQRAWNKCSADIFKFEIIEEVFDLNNLLEREQYWLDKTKCYESKFGYNISKVAGKVPNSQIKKANKKKKLLQRKDNYKNDLNNIKNNFLTNIEKYKNIINIKINIREKEISPIVFCWLKRAYENFPKFLDVITNNIIPNSDIIGKPTAEINIRHYKGNDCLSFDLWYKTNSRESNLSGVNYLNFDDMENVLSRQIIK